MCIKSHKFLKRQKKSWERIYFSVYNGVIVAQRHLGAKTPSDLSLMKTTVLY